MDDQNKNLLLATILCFGVMLLWFAIASPPEPVSEPVDTVADTSTDGPVADAGTDGTNGDDSALATPGSDTNIESALQSAPRITIKTPRVIGSMSLLGGRIDDLKLKDYNETADAGSPIVTLLIPEGRAQAYYGVHGWAPAGKLAPALVPGPDTVWLSKDTTLTPTSPVTLSWNNGAGQTFLRKISIDENYMFSVEQTVTNTGTAAVSMAPYGIIARHGEPANLKGFFILHEGMIRMNDGVLDYTKYSKMPDYDVDPKERAPADVARVQDSGWIGLTDHYWMTTLIPEGPFKSVSKYDPARDLYRTETVGLTQKVDPGQSITVRSRFFAGAKEWEAIRAYQNQGGVVKFVDSIDWGWFYFLTKPIFIMLHWLNGLIGNVGWSIIGLTLIIKAILLPLAYKSYVSMARMKELQPEMEKLKERIGDDRQKIQQGMMKLYKDNKVNPASGCLPILLQIPIFFSLYKVIFVTLELRHAPWFGPFQDLSAPDPTSIINVFGIFPWGGPEPGSILALLLIGILPLFLGISMWMQQRLNPAPTDPTQAMIFAWMPWVFMFMLGSFASGLIVYWIANNTITFAQQYAIMTSQGVKPDVFGNVFSSLRHKKNDKGDS